MSITQPGRVPGVGPADGRSAAARSADPASAAPALPGAPAASVAPVEPAVLARPAAPAGPGAPSVEALTASLPARLRRVLASYERTRDSLPDLAGCMDDPELSEAAQRVWDAERAFASGLVAQYRALAALHELEGEYEEVTEVDEVQTLRAALGLRVTRSAASWQLRDAYQAVHLFPGMLAKLDSGILPAAWFQKILRTSRKLSDSSRRDLDTVLSTWSTNITPERFFTLLRALVDHLAERENLPERSAPPERRVELLPGVETGSGTLQITGPIPEILARWKSLDESARAVQAAQRAALRDGTPIPHDPDGAVLESGRALPLSRLRFALLETAELDVDGVTVPVERFRLNVTVPVLTLLGASDQPGTLDGVTPLPPSIARSLAASCAVWHRILTEASSGAFLPLPADRVVPTPAMLEHLRLRNGQCAVPGCTRPTSWASECDHIEECLRGTPDAGGPTSIENLHLLCWQHHLDKTNGLLDPVRLPTLPEEPGRTRWRIGPDGDGVTVIDDIDAPSLHMVELLTAAWSSHLRGTRAGGPSPGADPGPGAGPSSGSGSGPGAGPRTGSRPGPGPVAPPPRPEPPEPPPEGWGDLGPPPF